MTTSEHELAILVHAALQRVGYSPADLPDTPGFVVVAHTAVANQPAEIEVSHEPPDDDAYVHAASYYRALVSDETLAGFALQFVPRPYPKVLVRGGGMTLQAASPIAPFGVTG